MKKDNKMICKLRKQVIAAMAVASMILTTTALPVQAAEEDRSFQVSILHTNDIHSRVESSDSSQILGLERVKTLADEKAAVEGNDGVLLLDAGDMYHGQSIATIDKGEAVAKLLKAAGYDAMTAGNHDWNYGKDRLKELVSISNVPILAGNVVDSANNAFFDEEYLIKEMQNEAGETLKVGIFGLIDPLIYQSTAPANVEGLTFTDMSAYAKEAAKELKEAGCHVVIALAHCIDPVALAEQVDDVDLWVAGHEHMELNEKVETPDGGTALVVETGYYLWTIGNVELNCTLTENGEVESLSLEEKMVSYNAGTEIVKDEAMTALFTEVKNAQAPLLEEEVAVISEELTGTWEEVRIGETTIGRAIAYGYLKETGADVAFENAGGVRSGISAGTVTYGDVLNVSPFGNYLITMKLSGKEILSMMENSIELMRLNDAANTAGEYDGWPSNSGSALQFAGIKVWVDMSKEQGSRIMKSEIGGKPVDLEKEYVVAMNNYMSTQTWEYAELTGKTTWNEYGACEDVLAAYLKDAGEQLYKDIHTDGILTYEADESETPEENKPSSPQTGDDSMIGFYALMMMAAAGVVVMKKKAYGCDR